MLAASETPKKVRSRQLTFEKCVDVYGGLRRFNSLLKELLQCERLLLFTEVLY